MYPSQTSLIPISVALTRFLEVNGISSVSDIYQYWYLGVPYRYLTGPVIPILNIFIHKLFVNYSLFEISIATNIISYFVGIIGWIVLYNKISRTKSKIISILLAVLLVLLPWRIYSSLVLNESTFTMARNLIPWFFLFFWKFLKGKKIKYFIISTTSLIFILLININIFAIFLIGSFSLILTASYKRGKAVNLANKSKKLLLVFLVAIISVTVWYTPGYWLTVLENPSIGGQSTFKVIFRIFDLLKLFVPIVLAFFTVRFSSKIKNRGSVFGLLWLLTFLFLIIYRFIADIDFWADWTTWLYELEVGIAIIAANLLGSFKELSIKLRAGSFFLVFLTVFITFRIHVELGKPRILSNLPPEGIAALGKLSEVAGGSRVFLSGSTVFWANALYDINQVRGGNDRAATNSIWNNASYQLREGSDVSLTWEWLKKLGVKYVLVHGQKSKEYYHDFNNISKWEKIGEPVYEKDGDIIYMVNSKDFLH